MTPFDWLFLAVLLTLLLINGIELWRIRRQTPPRDAGVREWIQVWPPDDLH